MCFLSNNGQIIFIVSVKPETSLPKTSTDARTSETCSHESDSSPAARYMSNTSCINLKNKRIIPQRVDRQREREIRKNDNSGLNYLNYLTNYKNLMGGWGKQGRGMQTKQEKGKEKKKRWGMRERRWEGKEGKVELKRDPEAPGR